MANTKGIPFTLGAKVVGVSSLVISLYLAVLGTAMAVAYFVVKQEICRLVPICGYGDIYGYAAIGVGVYGLISTIFAILLLIGVKKDNPNMMVPHILLDLLSILAILGLMIYYGIVVSSIIYKIIIAVSGVVGLILPIYYHIVVVKHSIQLRRATREDKKTTPVVPFHQPQPQIGFLAFSAPQPMPMMQPSPQYPQKLEQPLQTEMQQGSPLFSNRSSNNSLPPSVVDVD